MKSGTLSDQEIVAGIKAKDSLTFQYLYKKYGPIVVAYVMKNSGSNEEGLEVLQLALLKVWDNIQQDKYNAQGKFSSYLMGIAINTWKTELRRKRRHPTQNLGEKEAWLEDEGQEDLLRKMSKQASTDAIYRALGRLGELCRELIELYHLQEVALKEIALQKDYDYNNLRKRIYDCRHKLRKLAEEEMRSVSSKNT